MCFCSGPNSSQVFVSPVWGYVSFFSLRMSDQLKRSKPNCVGLASAWEFKVKHTGRHDYNDAPVLRVSLVHCTLPLFLKPGRHWLV